MRILGCFMTCQKGRKEKRRAAERPRGQNADNFGQKSAIFEGVSKGLRRGWQKKSRRAGGRTAAGQRSVRYDGERVND